MAASISPLFSFSSEATTREHTGSRKDADKTILDAVEELYHLLGHTTVSQNVSGVDNSNGKTGRGDLLTQYAHSWPIIVTWSLTQLSRTR